MVVASDLIIPSGLKHPAEWNELEENFSPVSKHFLNARYKAGESVTNFKIDVMEGGSESNFLAIPLKVLHLPGDYYRCLDSR
jgi:hypothetical protein